METVGFSVCDLYNFNVNQFFNLKFHLILIVHIKFKFNVNFNVNEQLYKFVDDYFVFDNHNGLVMATHFDQLDAALGSVNRVTSLPQTPSDYYGALYGINLTSWQGGEIVYLSGSGTGHEKIYIQTATSGTTPTWRTIAAQFVTF